MLFDSDRGFWSGVYDLITTTRRPIILTSNGTVPILLFPILSFSCSHSFILPSPFSCSSFFCSPFSCSHSPVPHSLILLFPFFHSVISDSKLELECHRIKIVFDPPPLVSGSCDIWMMLCHVIYLIAGGARDAYTAALSVM